MNASVVLSGVLIAVGVAAIARTLQLGVGGGLGLLLGALLISAGAARLWLARKAP